MVVQLTGGNDYFNTVIPYNEGLYYDNRPTVHYEVWIRKRRGEVELGLHFEGDAESNLRRLDLLSEQRDALIKKVGKDAPFVKALQQQIDSAERPSDLSSFLICRGRRTACSFTSQNALLKQLVTTK